MTKQEKQQWTEEIEKASAALNWLIEMQGELEAEYEEWTQKRKEGEKGQAVQAIIDIDLSSWDEELNQLEGLIEGL